MLLDRIYTILSWKDTAGDYYSSVNSYYELEDDVVDVLFLGSSHCYCSVDPSVLWDKYGIASFNLAISGQDFAGTYYTLKEALKTQKPQLVCMELFYSNRTGYQVDGNLYRNTLPFKFSKNSYEVVDSLVQDEERKKDLWLRWPILHTRYKELQEEDFRIKSPTYLGYRVEFATNDVGSLPLYTGNEILELPEERNEWLLKIVNLAKENDIQLCFFIAPYVASEEDQKLWKAVKKLAEEEDIPVLDMVELSGELGLDTRSDFCDWQHTNYYGAQKVSKYLGAYIKENYNLEDYRGQEVYALWDENSKVCNHEVKAQELRSVTDMGNYLDKISLLEESVVVISTAGNHLAEEMDISDRLYELGIGDGFYTVGGLWVIEDSKMCYAALEADAFYHVDLDYSDLLVSRAEGVNSVVVDKQQYQKVIDGINILVYDKVLGKVADCVGFSTAASYQAVR